MTAQERVIRVEGLLGKHYDWVDLEWHSSRNARPSRFWDISQDNPAKDLLASRRDASDGDLIFPVVDVEVTCDMTARAEFSTESFEYTFNRHTDNRAYPGARALTLTPDRLEPWENVFYVTPKQTELTGFCLIKRVRLRPQTQRRLMATLRPLADTVDGVVKCYGVEADGTRTFEFAQTVAPAAPAQAKTLAGDLSPAELRQVILETSAYLQRSVVRAPHSIFNEGIFCFYDLPARTYRLSPWMWQWGTAIHAMLRAARQAFVPRQLGEALTRDAWGIGNTSLKFQVDNEEHVTHGLGTFRDDARPVAPGMLEFITCGSDSNFLAGWGWMPLYQATGDARFLDASQTLAQATSRMLDLFDLPPQDFDSQTNDWTNHTLDESGFGPEGLAELYAQTRDPWLKALTKRYTDAHLAKLERPDGLWEASWLRAEQRCRPLTHRTRGLAWAMEGLLSSAKVMPDGPYVEKAARMAQHLLDHQHADGHWNYRFTEPTETSGISEKGTAIWSILLSRLYDFTGDERHLAASRRALAWCIRNLYTGPDPLGHGAIPSQNEQSGVIYRPWFPITCIYASAFLCTAACMEYERQQGAYVPWDNLESSRQFGL